MNAEWQLESLGKIITGKTPPKSVENAYSSAGAPFITPRDMDGRKWVRTTERYLSKAGLQAVRGNVVPVGSIAVSCIGSDMGKAVRVAVDSVTNQQINTLIPDGKKCDADYLYYLLATMQEEFKSIAGGSATPILNKGHFSQVQVYLPVLSYQRQAAKILAAFDDKIELNQQTNQTLEQIAQAIFKSWFVDFEPTRAKIIAQDMGADTATQELAAQAIICGATTLEQLADIQQNLSSHLQQAIDEKLSHNTPTPINAEQLATTAALFPNALVESELGEIPEGWSVAAISDFGEVVCGKTPSKKKPEYYGNEVPFIKIPDMHGNVFVTKASECLSKEGAASQPKKSIPKGSICVSCIATVGLVVIAVEDSHTNQQINSIVPHKEAYTPYLYFRMKSLNRHLHELASGGSATLNLNTGNFSRIQIIKPVCEALNLYQNYAAPLLDAIHDNSNENHSLAELRDTLLPKLLSGELDVSALANNSVPASKTKEALDV